MKRLFLWVGAALLAGTQAMAQGTSLQTLLEDMKEAQDQHDAASSQQMTNFINQLDAASQSPDAALALFQQAGGDLPDPTAVSKHYNYETPTEKAARLAADQQNMTIFASVAQYHCGLMKNAALVLSKPNDKATQAAWIAWLKNTATIYPQLGGKLPLKAVTLKDSIISKYLGFHGWGTSDQGTWALSQLPMLYKELVLEPLRNPPGPGTLDAWNTYIAMRKADDPDPDHFTSTTEPPLDFDRAADDFAIQPSMDKLQLIDQLIKANPTNDHLSDWIARARQMIAVYSGGGAAVQHSPLPGATPGTSDSSSAGVTPTASPGTTSSGTGAPNAVASPGASYGGGTAPTPTASPGTSSSGGASPLPTASPGTSSSGTSSPTPTASPGTPSAGGTSPTPTATP